MRDSKFDELSDGKQSIDGNRIFALFSTYTTQNETERLFEAHRKYIDIQYIVQGSEIIYWSLDNNLITNGEYSEQNDIIFFKGEGINGFPMRTSYFSIFFPQDAHKPCCILDKPEEVKKVVVKVLI